MKKVVILVIVLIFLASIVAVNFFGLQIKMFEGTVYVTHIDLLGIERQDLIGTSNSEYRGTDGGKVLTDKSTGESQYFFDFSFIPAPEGTVYTAENLSENPNTFYIDFDVLPHDANVKGVDFVYEEDDRMVFDEKTRTVIFLSPMTVSLSLRAIDGSEVRTKRFYISCR